MLGAGALLPKSRNATIDEGRAFPLLIVVSKSTVIDIMKPILNSSIYIYISIIIYLYLDMKEVIGSIRFNRLYINVFLSLSTEKFLSLYPYPDLSIYHSTEKRSKICRTLLSDITRSRAKQIFIANNT